MSSQQVQKSITEVNKLQQAITKCFNPKIGTLDLTKLNTQLKQEKINLEKISSD